MNVLEIFTSVSLIESEVNNAEPTTSLSAPASTSCAAVFKLTPPSTETTMSGYFDLILRSIRESSITLITEREMPSSLASLFYLLESPFSCLFAVLLLGETLSLKQGLGALLILAACLIAVLAEHRKRQGAEALP